LLKFKRATMAKYRLVLVPADVTDGFKVHMNQENS
jgi:hypothetical protein